MDDAPVLVTGASGFIAMHIVALLQREGHRVRGTVRDPGGASAGLLRELCSGARYPLQLVAADLTHDAGWAEAAAGCRYAVHVASPFPKAPPSHEEELLLPAVEGTRRVLRACAAAGTVHRVVLTSSISAVHGETGGGGPYVEEDWSDVGSPALDAYAKSKTLAERAAWELVADLARQGRPMELAVLNPGLVMGPPLGGSVCTSLELVKRLMDGSMPLVPRLHLALCDVRDVALAHVRALRAPGAAGHRHIVVSSHLWLQDVAHILRNEFAPQGYFVPTWPVPRFALWLYSFVDYSTRLILDRVDQCYLFANHRMKEVLQLEPRPVEHTLVDTVYALVESGEVKKTQLFNPRK